MGDDRKTGSGLFIVDNSDADWKVRDYLLDWWGLAKTIDIATGYFEIGALLACRWQRRRPMALRHAGHGDQVLVLCRKYRQHTELPVFLSAAATSWLDRGGHSFSRCCARSLRAGKNRITSRFLLSFSAPAGLAAIASDGYLHLVELCQGRRDYARYETENP